MEKINKINDFLTEAKTFYIVSVDGEKPKARPISFKMIEEGKLWFGVGTFKDVYKQLEKNNHVEVIANVGSKWMRYDGITHFVLDRDDLEEKAFSLLPGIGKMYKENGWKMGLFYIENAHVEFKNVMNTEDSFDL